MRIKLAGARAIIVVSCEKEELLGSLGRILFKHKIALKPTERDDRALIVDFCLKHTRKQITGSVNCMELAKLLQGKSFRDIQNLLTKLGRQLPESDVEKFLTQGILEVEKERKFFGEKSVRIPEVKWADVGGLADAKEDIIQTIMLPIEKPHLFKSGVA